MNPLHLIWIIPLAASIGFFAGTMMRTAKHDSVDLPYWMWERIVQILDGYPYSGAPDIVQAIKEQMKE